MEPIVNSYMSNSYVIWSISINIAVTNNDGAVCLVYR